MRDRWLARIALFLSTAMAAGLLTVMHASGQDAGEPLLAVDVDVTSASVTQVTYGITVTNFGDATATAVNVTDTVPANTTFESATPQPSAGCDNAGNRENPGTTCEWAVGDIAPGDSAVISAVFNLAQGESAYTVTNSAEATASTGQEDSDSDASLRREKISAGDDTFVDDTEAANTNHGDCSVLRTRRDNAITSFVDLEPLPSDSSIETLFGAQLRLTVRFTEYSGASPGSIGAHRITSADWTEGPGSCGGEESTTATDARTGSEPTSNPSATDTAQVSFAEQVVRHNVTADLDSSAERGTYEGWELRDSGAGTGAGFTEFDSLEGRSGQQPRLFLVFTRPESPTCVDGDPEAATLPPTAVHEIEARVTDGTKISNSAGDACNGTPIATQGVIFEVEDDTPDIWISSRNGEPLTKTVTAGGDAQPDSVTAPTDSSGIARITIQLDDPQADNSGENRVGARIEGTTDPESSNECQAGLPTCQRETDTEDDVRATWDPAASPTPTPTGSPSPTPTGSPSPTPTGSPTPTPTPTQAPRQVTIVASDRAVVFNNATTLSGRIVSNEPGCADQGEFVQIQRRFVGQGERFRDLRGTNVDADGAYEVTVRIRRNARYVAVAPSHDNCAEASSDPVEVGAKVRVRARASDDVVRRGDRVAIFGRVRPNHKGTKVVLQRRRGGSFVRVATVKLNDRSRYRFVIEANWRRNRVFRVRWPKADRDHQANTSRRMRIRARG